jgi:serine/threonine-protein kinase
MLGTPAAMAPELMMGLPVNAATDVYAIGLLAYHMLTGAPAFAGTPGVVQSYLQIHGPRPRPSAKVDIDPAIDEPIVRALAPDPKARYASPRELVDALRAIIEPSNASAEQDVVTLYVEGGPVELAQAATFAANAGMTIAMTAPDSLIAVAPKLDVADARNRLEEIARAAKVALGTSRATICGGVVDGPALDVEAWAPYPLEGGLWITPSLL